MTPQKRVAAVFLLVGLLLSVGTPLWLSYRIEFLATYLMHPAVLAMQAVPYLLCAGLWLPWKARETGAPALVLSGLLLLGSAVFNLPMVVEPGRAAGDMISLAFMGVTLGATLVLLAGSLPWAMFIWWRRRAGNAPVSG
jgi:hypothetical protein